MKKEIVIKLNEKEEKIVSKVLNFEFERKDGLSTDQNHQKEPDDWIDANLLK